MDYISLGPAPYDEDPVQVGCPDYSRKALAECKRYKAMLERMFPVPYGVNAYFQTARIESNLKSHLELCVFYDETSTDAFIFACSVNNNIPSHWEGGILKRGNFV